MSGSSFLKKAKKDKGFWAVGCLVQRGGWGWLRVVGLGGGFFTGGKVGGDNEWWGNGYKKTF